MYFDTKAFNIILVIFQIKIIFQPIFFSNTTQSLGVNPTKISSTCRYAKTSKFKWMSKALLPFGSSLSLWEFPPPVLP